MLAALAHDLGKPLFEGYSTDIATIIGEIKYMFKNLERLARTRKVQTVEKLLLYSLSLPS